MRALITPYWTQRGSSIDLWRDMDRFLESFATPTTTPALEREFAPATEITESEHQYQLSIDLPGIKQEDIKVEVLDNKLSVTGERKRENKTESDKAQRLERSYGFFRRSFTLPKNVATDKIEARYADGVLELSVPKAELAQSRKIEIQIPQKATN